jgi:hypothetical protein
MFLCFIDMGKKVKKDEKPPPDDVVRFFLFFSYKVGY